VNRPSHYDASHRSTMADQGQNSLSPAESSCHDGSHRRHDMKQGSIKGSRF
ncbi:hypothetical protein A2U01_0085999, partial [Trifolium medium]|nr:hypothetical protein [Trifolium medium]